MRTRIPLLAALALSCASAPEAPRARVSVEILSGFAALPAPETPGGRTEAPVRLVVSPETGDAGVRALCGSLSRRVAEGARVELWVPDGAEAPACAADLVLSGPPDWAAPPSPPRFWVEPPPGQAEPGVIGAGRADGAPRSVPPGSGVVVVDLDPQARIGPIPLPADALTRVTILDFPTLDPPVREWIWSAEGSAPAGRSSP